MRNKIIVLLLIFIPIFAQAQSIDEILSSIEENNLSLKALRSLTQAQCEDNLSSTFLPDPSIEFAYLWGSEAVGRKDISIEQSFDYATISGLRKNTALKQNELLYLEYRLTLRDVLLNAQNLVSEIIYRNALLNIYSKKLSLTHQLEQSYRKGFDLGEFSIIEYQDASLELLSTENRYTQLLIERDELLQQLALLNGGIKIDVSENELIIPLLPKDFQTYLDNAQSPSLQYYKNVVEKSEKELQLAKSEAIPSLSVGYMAELVPGSDFRGVKMGLSLPLWSSKSKIRAAKKKRDAAEEKHNAEISEYGLKAQSLYNKVLSLSLLATNAPNSEIEDEIYTALSSGHIDIITSIESINSYYNALEENLNIKLSCILSYNKLKSL